LVRHDRYEHTRYSVAHASVSLEAKFFLAAFASLREIILALEVSENAVANQIVDAAYRVHTTLGPGLLESVYQAALAYELEKRGMRVARQQAIPVVYEAVRIDTGFYADLVVDNQVIVEIKAVETIAPVHKKQLLTYLKLADKRLGLLINFNVTLIKAGIIRIVNGLKE
jgi:GxxExxY protein